MKELEEIQAETEAVKQADTVLQAINTTSKTSVWGQLRDTIANIIYTVYNFFELYKKDVNTLAERGYLGSKAWFVAEAKRFQYGHELELINNRFTYSTIDEAAMIVKQASITVINKTLQFKVAGEDTGGNLIPLSVLQMDSFTAYLQKIKYPGTPVVVVSTMPDILNLNFKIYYDATILKSEVEQNVNNVIDSYLKNLVFDGRFSISECIETIHTVDGVCDVFYLSADGRGYYALPGDAEMFFEYYNSKAGYMIIDNLTLTMLSANQ